jgi:hypothetical protein
MKKGDFLNEKRDNFTGCCKRLAKLDQAFLTKIATNQMIEAYFLLDPIPLSY